VAPRAAFAEQPGRGPHGRRRRAAAAGATLALLLCGAVEVAAQATTLRGEVLLRDGQPATDVRLVVVGHPPEVALRDNGLFVHSLAGTPSEITVRVVGQPGTEVLFPPGGRVVVPADPAAVVSILVGERIGASVQDRIGRDLQALRETLEVRGVSEAEIEAVIRAELDSLAVRIEAITAVAVATAVAGAAQTELRERVNRYLGTYVRRSRDLVDAFALVDVRRRLGQSEFLVLWGAIGNYSDAYGELDRELAEAPAALQRAWHGAEGIAIRDHMAAVLDLIESRLHPEMLALREPLVVIQLDFTHDRPPARDVAAARQAVTAALPRLHPLVEQLEAEFPGLMAELRRSTSH
jgi:hypothetical protein